MSTTYEPTQKTQVRRRPDRGNYDRAVVHKIIDEALVAHVAFVENGEPRVLPTTIVRIDEDVYIHGSPNNNLLSAIAAGAPACIEMTLVDSIVAGRSGFGCSMDYRSVVIYGRAEQVTEPGEKERIIDALVQDIIPGHIVRRPKRKELAATLVLRFPLIEVSAKIRDAGNIDVEEDYDLDLWAGVIPLGVAAGPGKGCPRLKPGIETPGYALNYKR